MGYQRLKVVFDGPPAPESGRFIEVEREDGSSVCAGEWEDLQDGTWALWLRVIDEDVFVRHTMGDGPTYAQPTDPPMGIGGHAETVHDIHIPREE